VSSAATLSIMHIAAPGEVGGLERVLHALAVGMNGRGHAIHVAAVLDRRQRAPHFLEQLHAAGVHVHPIVLRPRAYLAERREVRRLCRAIAPDVVHTHSDRPDVLDAPVARRLGIPTVTTLHGSSKMGGKASVYEWIQLKMLRRFSAIVVVSEPLVREVTLYGVDTDRVHLIPNAWCPRGLPLERSDAREALGVPHSEPIIGWVGRLIPVKAPDLFVEALALLRERRWHAVVIGDGPARAAAESLARARGIRGRITFAGALPNAAPYFSAFDVFVLSSRSEGTPITIFEAMSARVPIVATRVGGVPQVLDDTDAMLVEPESPAALAVELDAALDSLRDSSARTARAAARLTSRYAIGPWLDAHERLYGRLARDAHPAAVSRRRPATEMVAP